MKGKRLFLLRGLPGSGKSSLAAWLTDTICRAPGEAAVFYEADDFFVDDEGIYTFNPAKLGDAHYQCKKAVWEAMSAEVPVVIVSNTFSQNWEIRDYEKWAVVAGYQVTVLTVESGLSNADLAARNEHGCPEEKIGEMRARFENYVNPCYAEEVSVGD